MMSAAPTLPADVARCEGVGSAAEGWREGCETCLRRIAVRPARVVMMQPPAVLAFSCSYEIEPQGHETLCPLSSLR